MPAIMIEHVNANGRREIAETAFGVDGRDEVGQRIVTTASNLLKSSPERVFETDAGLVTGNNDRAFDNGRLHRFLTVVIQTDSRRRLMMSP